jgi:hypothetical protein
MPKRRPPGEKPFAIFEDSSLLEAMRDAAAAAEELPAADPLPESPVRVVQVGAGQGAPTAAARGPRGEPRPVPALTAARRVPAPPPMQPTLAPAQDEPELRQPRPTIGMEPTELIKFRVPLPTKNSFQAFRAEWRAALGAQIDESQVGRVLIDVLLLELAPYILDVTAERGDPIKRPVNRDHVAMAAFEESLKAIVLEATKRHRRRLRNEEAKPMGRA